MNLSEQDKNRIYKFVLRTIQKKHFDIEVQNAIKEDLQTLLKDKNKEEQVAMMTDFINFIREKILKERGVSLSVVAVALKTAKSQGVPDFYISLGQAVFGTGFFNRTPNPDEMLKTLEVKPGVKKETNINIDVGMSAEPDRSPQIKTQLDEKKEPIKNDDSFFARVRSFFATIFRPIILLRDAVFKSTVSTNEINIQSDQLVHDHQIQPHENNKVTIKPEPTVSVDTIKPENHIMEINSSAKDKDKKDSHHKDFPFPSKVVKTFRSHMHMPHIGHHRKHTDTSRNNSNYSKIEPTSKIEPMATELNQPLLDTTHNQKSSPSMMKKIFAGIGLGR